MGRFKNAFVIFSFFVVAIGVAVSIDYTDTYVSDRFHAALESGQYEEGDPISLDAFIEYYDWDKVCLVLPGMDVPELKNRLGLPYKHGVEMEGVWSLVFLKSDYVVSEIVIDRSVLEMPSSNEKKMYDRWSTIVVIATYGEGKQIEFMGD